MLSLQNLYQFNDIDLSGINNFIYSNNFYYLMIRKTRVKIVSGWNNYFDYYELYKLSPDIKIIETLAKYEDRL